jgi:transcriptional regulator with XRE-family HTH domain
MSPRTVPTPPDVFDVDTTTVGLTLRRLREEAGLSRTQLGAAIGLTDQSVAGYERGLRPPPFAVLVRIASALGTTVAELVGETAAVSNAEVVEARAS